MTRLEQERRRRQWTQTDLAARAKMGQSDISLLESGKIVYIGRKRLARLARVLGISAEALLASSDAGST
ncbi:MAG TPA: transcriptional regulator [Candidatus Omnitrophica bacterium]|nr:transcriptional regulator [Candidatus Omnitrophota bacterium]